MNTKNPGLMLLDKKVDELGLRRQVEDELAQILIEHKIANLRRQQGLTQAALAARSGVSQPMIAQIESGKLSNLTLKTLARTARALGANLKIDLVPQPKPAPRRIRAAQSLATSAPSAARRTIVIARPSRRTTPGIA
jgi:transcriptional regulator with XRE-family HTH domain